MSIPSQITVECKSVHFRLDLDFSSVQALSPKSMGVRSIEQVRLLPENVIYQRFLLRGTQPSSCVPWERRAAIPPCK